MKNKELITALSEKMGVPVKDISALLFEFQSTLSDSVMESEDVELEGLGTFTVQKEQMHVAYDEAANKRYLIPPKLFPKFISEISLLETNDVKKTGG